MSEAGVSSDATAMPSPFSFKYFDPEGKPSEYAELHGQLIEHDPVTAKETVIWESEDMSTIPALKDLGNSLTVFARPSEDTLILRSVVIQSDAIHFGLFAFDLPTKTLSAMKINDPAFYLGATPLSADQRTMVWAEQQDDEGRIGGLWVADLVNDTSKPLVTLANAAESLGSGCQDLGCTSHDYRFTAPRTVHYAIYNWVPCTTVGVTCDASQGRPVLRYESVEISEEQ